MKLDLTLGGAQPARGVRSVAHAKLPGGAHAPWQSRAPASEREAALTRSPLGGPATSGGRCPLGRTLTRRC
eukprot:1012219-Alexandrium_andersonii.AAC.1